jgi:NAD(P)-dependent dehydrogenase (short-subunit alcohol dehydrogenase family)
MSDKGVVVVTGGSRGIGAATALLLARRGHALVVNYSSDAEAAGRVVAAITDAGGAAVAVRGDVSDEADVTALFAAADGLGRLVGLVNNAGLVDRAARIEELTARRINRILAVNLTGTMLCSGQAVRRMSPRFGGSGGAIVNLSSGAAKLGGAGTYLDYAAAKGGIDTLTIGMALELAADGIRVNAVRPGIIATDIHAAGGDPDRVKRLMASVPMPRAGEPEEVAEAIAWLLSDAASYCTGTTIDVTGGRAITP